MDIGWPRGYHRLVLQLKAYSAVISSRDRLRRRDKSKARGSREVATVACFDCEGVGKGVEWRRRSQGEPVLY